MRVRLPLSVIALLHLLIYPGCSSHLPDQAGSARYYGVETQLDYEVRLGRQLFQRYCAVCHGLDGGGDGFNSYNLNPRPRDPSNPDFQASLDDSRLADVIRNGGGFRGGSHYMPAWGGTLDELALSRIVKYIRHLSGHRSAEPSSPNP